MNEICVARSPLRISFAGGGSDLPSFYKAYRGSVVSVAISRYVDVCIRKIDSGAELLFETVSSGDSFSDIGHPMLQQAFMHHGFDSGFRIATFSDAPTSGSGLGSSSSLLVATSLALRKIKGLDLTPELLAKDSSTIEIERCGRKIGKQDQYAAAYGGIRHYEFNSDDSVSVSNLSLELSKVKSLENSMLLFDTGLRRDASQALEKQNTYVTKSKKIEHTNRLVSLADNLRDDFMSGNIDTLGPILNEGWEVKRSLGSSNSHIDALYAKGIKAGATGGKLLGAGDGGHILFIVPPDKCQAVIDSVGLKRIPIKIDLQGARASWV